jgi:hypothetical protein
MEEVSARSKLELRSGALADAAILRHIGRCASPPKTSTPFHAGKTSKLFHCPMARRE